MDANKPNTKGSALMATIYKEVEIDRPVAELWKALSDVAHVDRLLSYLDGVEMDGNYRSCALDNGAQLREVIISNDDSHQRMAYSVIEEPFGFEHHSASWQAFAEGERSRFVWITDVLPDAVVEALEPLIDQSINDIRNAVETS